MYDEVKWEVRRAARGLRIFDCRFALVRSSGFGVGWRVAGRCEGRVFVDFCGLIA